MPRKYKKKEKVKTLCICGCGEYFFTNRKGKYKGDHRNRVYQKEHPRHKIGQRSEIIIDGIRYKLTRINPQITTGERP